MKRGRAESILDEVIAAVRRWDEFSAEAAVIPSLRDLARGNFRLAIPSA